MADESYGQSEAVKQKVWNWEWGECVNIIHTMMEETIYQYIYNNQRGKTTDNINFGWIYLKKRWIDFQQNKEVLNKKTLVNL